MKDIETREDILLIIRNFYDRLLKDQSINFFFTKATDVDQHLEKHFDILATFWEQALFLKGGYSNNMFQIHKDVHDKHPFTQEHFEIWLDHFYTSIDESYVGNKADQMKTMSLNMATIMRMKFNSF
ncbi:group III truncated hemoglobin [Flavobacterium urocaniciphilum]|uniref:Hemoglobin n=1 Tax=Flavobacterium urocaniciphilum TaxID=1299341 RepID=A0A1H9C8U4_9FLAO|nr:group III truncated hemoglobin [Flavobacterium urocaniciphilum]SEP97582.1 hemoglobin [Flavobacterium urocaniciphilum]